MWKPWKDKPAVESVAEAEEDAFVDQLSGLQQWDVMVMNNFYSGKYPDYSARYYSVVASSPEEARQVVVDNADYVLQDLLSRKLQNGKKVLPRGSALPIEDKRVGKAKPGTLTTMGFKKMLSPDGVKSFKFASGKIVDSEEQGVAEGRATYGPVTDQHKAASKKAFNAGVRDGKAGVEKNKEYMSSALMKTTYLNGYKQGKQGVAEGQGSVSVRQWANQVRRDHGSDVKFRNRQEGGGAVDSVIAKNSNGETVGVYNRKTGYPTVYEPKQGVAEGSTTLWEVSFDYGPHQSDSVKVKARSAQEAVDKVETAAEKKGRSIMVNWARPTEQSVAEGIVYNTLTIDNQNLIDQKAKSKPDGIYTFRGIMFRVKNGRATHYAAESSILASYGNFNTAVGSYSTRDEAKAKLKSIKEGLAEGINPEHYDVQEASLAQMRDYFNQDDSDSVKVNRNYDAPSDKKNPAGVPPKIQALVNKMYHAGKISPQEFETLRKFQRQTKINVGIREADANPYVIGMAQAMKSTGDKPPLKKSTINKAHAIARAVKKGD
jgi:hypothetical protein